MQPWMMECSVLQPAGGRGPRSHERDPRVDQLGIDGLHLSSNSATWDWRWMKNWIDGSGPVRRIEEKSDTQSSSCRSRTKRRRKITDSSVSRSSSQPSCRTTPAPWPAGRLQEIWSTQDMLQVNMSKRKISLDSCSAATKPPAKRQQQHLYLVLDDWEDGYSVHKVDVSSFDSDAGAHEGLQPKPFAEPPVARFGAVHGNSHAFLTHGTKIIAMKPPDISPAIPAFDTATSAVVTLPWPGFRMNFGRPILISIAGKIFLFINDTHYLGDPPQPPPPRRAINGGWYYQTRVREPWVWTAVGSPQARLPFTANSSYCHALHPDGRTLVVSASKWDTELKEGTFSFDTERLEWTCHGSWQLPFYGRAYYVAELDAWVGICRHKNGTGHLCSSDVLPVSAGPTTLPCWKLGEERLFDRDSPLHLGARLVHMGGTRFCLVQYMWHDDDDDIRRAGEHTELYVAPPRVVVRMTTFGVQHSEDGELRLESARARRCNVFRRPHGFVDTRPVAFWI